MLDQVAVRLDDAPVIRGRFEQTRKVAGFAMPLVSRGDFVLARGRGLLWQTRAPIASSLLLTPRGLTMRGADGSVQQQLQADAQPGMRAALEAILAVLRADAPALAQRFAMTGEVHGKQGWRLALTPTDADMRRVLKRVDLEGDRFVREVRLQEASGDSTVVRLLAPMVAGADAAREIDVD
ncbi:outer membrane lipoprotein carrier protein LolA [Cupriavidus sp. UGS-1]|uniref:outer membrane lipoprotein carrier protein LolA n=1 Tax=Cupriavidus sp. UGS-1 TaxID=2899826 RepID=UPI001E5D6717|nr:outer membrane lipoprotein carrier protein LolA [Cupriavidus sp. UGS-1]MCD9120396.1 outer membrane lipoprotein carrier protein LolA [Cupriavidus sp. UGS-1]